MNLPNPFRPLSSAFWLKTFVAVVCLAILALEGWRDWEERNDEVARAEGVMEDLARSLAQHAQDTFELADAILIDIVYRAEDLQASPAIMEEMDAFLAERIQFLPRFKTLTVYGEDGRLLSSSLPGHRHKVSVRDQVFFQHHKSWPNNRWFLGPLIRDPIGSDWVLTLSRGFRKPDGGFGGVVQVSISPQYFSNFYARFNIGAQGTITLFSTDGIILARYPYLEAVIGRSLSGDRLFQQYLPQTSAGSYVYRSQFDGFERLSGYQRGQSFPVVTLAAMGKEEVLAPWNREFLYRALAVSLFVVTIALLGWNLARQLKRREQAEAELAVLAATDGLTGLANRRTFDKQLETEWLRAARDGTPLSLLLLDIDHFKPYNDTYGHQAGDLCLQTVAAILKSCLKRPADLVARYGGEEIAVLLPATDAKGAALVAEDARARIEALAIHHEGNAPLKILTISIGSASLVPAVERLHSRPRELVALADSALYRAKIEGRNRVSVSEAA